MRTGDWQQIQRHGARALTARMAIPVLSLVYCVLLLVLSGGAAMNEINSAGYLAFNSERTAGYPLFLKLVGLLTGTPERAPLLQSPSPDWP